MKKHATIWGLAGCALGLLALMPLTAQADVKIQRFTHFDEVTGITAHDSNTTDYIQGDKKREENRRKFTGAVLGAWQRFRHEDKGALSVDIYNVGTNKHFELDPKEKTYSEEPIYTPVPKQSGEESRGGTAHGGQSSQGSGEQESESDTKVTKNEFTVKATGKKKNLNGFDAVEYLITWDVETVNTKTGDKGKSLMTTDLWTSTDPRLAKAHAEEAAYNEAYRKLMHEPTNIEEMHQYGFGTVTTNGADPKQFFEKLKTIKGYPVSTDVRWETAGSGEKDKSEHPTESVDSAIGSLFGHHSEKKKQSGHAGMTTVFHSHVEIKAVSFDKVDPALFKVPDNYKTG